MPAAETKQHARTSRRQRSRQLTWSAGFAIASLYLLFAAGASLVTYQSGVKPASATMARTHAEHVAEITFESLYSLMLAGAGRERLQDAALRMEHTGSGISIHIVRGPHLVAQFGDLRDSRALRRSDPMIRRAFATGRPQTDDRGDYLHIAYPALFRQPCLACHTQGIAGEVAGVVAVTYPNNAIVEPRRQAMLPLLLFFVVGFPVATLATYLLTRGNH